MEKDPRIGHRLGQIASERAARQGKSDINGFCPCCLEYVLAAALVEENPGLCMDDAVNVVSEWIMCAGGDVN